MRRAVLAVVGLLACGPRPTAPAARVRVVTTIGVLADWVRQVGGDRVAVASLLSGSESPHTYEAKPQDAQALARADVLFRVGLGLEEWLDPVIQNSGNRRLSVLEAAAGVSVIQDDEREHAAGNPHVWLDPEYAKAAAGRLAAALAQADPAGESRYRARARAYGLRLDSLAATISAEAARLPDRRFVSYHEAWPYFCRRFGYATVASIEPIPGQEPSARELARMTDLIRRAGVKVIVTEPQLPSALPAMLARETGIRVLMLNPLLADSTGSVDYINGLGRAAHALAAALGE